ncbi:NAD(P)/FAD-dependent oxidoreductase [Pseudonocardia endophytica]|uniref:3-phenylpropionate/trans-cinnamate dioxygenase ferredoxin reductase subunit n=1 Tax=Pseudonocardia endophytica TaxID=401976 RepID=A0A4V2PHT6_PSEEN|nr:FAD-dependent oxidoreductase [Pseudonocardia endophytica]TCK22026.1 3-phenylpropionate/trans-cinnamate dioxygenase ferredoxin reductase subunit [Pseudonocardia endophytica]
MTRFVLVGGGVATAATATGLREGGFDGEIVIVAGESHLPYERPPLSKEYLAGTFAVTDFQANDESWYSDNAVELVLGTRVLAVSPGERRVSLSDGRPLGYDALVLATGVRARTLPGFDGDRVHALRTLADSERLGSRLVAGSRLAVLGAGFVGCEVAAVAAARGVRVTVFEPEPLPLGRALGPEVGRAITGIHAENGVEIRTGQVIRSMTETGSGLELTTRDGEVVECDELLVGVGSVPNVELAVAAGLEVGGAAGGGILTDEFGRTSAPDVYAIGDVAERFYPPHGRRIRVEHHDTAVKHGANTARNLLGEAEPFTDRHFFWSHQYDHNLQSLGRFTAEGTRVVRGSLEERSFTVFSLVDGRIGAMVALNRPRDLLQARKVMAVPHEVTADQLADEEFPLKSLLPSKASARRSEVAG